MQGQNRLLKWQHPFYPDVQTAKMPGYNVLELAKYGKKVLLERFMHIAQASREASWVSAYVTGLRCGELTICKDAVSRLEALQTALQGKPAPLTCISQVHSTV